MESSAMEIRKTSNLPGSSTIFRRTISRSKTQSPEKDTPSSSATKEKSIPLAMEEKMSAFS